MQMMKQSLNLTDEQAKQLEPVFKKQQAMINALRTNTALSRQERAARMREIRQTSDTSSEPPDARAGREMEGRPSPHAAAPNRRRWPDQPVFLHQPASTLVRGHN